jgi:tRNA modification GTPase
LALRDLSSTLVAIATPPGRGGVGCVRISGDDAPRIAAALFSAASERDEARPGTARFGRFLGRDGAALDHGYLVEFEAGRSFTGEATAELWPHGSPAVLAELLETAMAHGAVAAGPGEFTYRALSNGRLDLARAEAVRDLVEARTLYQARVAFAQAEGALSRRLAPLRLALEEWIARGEAAVEFVDEAETHLPKGDLHGPIDELLDTCRSLLAGFRTGRVVRDGATLAMVGLPNVGKSSLFNRLLDRERAIVTELPGTTRDTLEEQVNLDGIPLRLIDTAGLREVADPVESEGVRRAEQAREEADLVLLVLDGSRPMDELERAAIERALGEEEKDRTVLALNKSDLKRGPGRDLPPGTALTVSALTGDGIDDLRAELRRRLVGGGILEDPIVTDSRHARALEAAAAALERAREAARGGLSDELLLEDMREARGQIGEITGEFGNEALYDRIFSTFCIGK